MKDLKYIIAHLPADLNARFAGVGVELTAIRKTQAMHTQRFSTLECKLDFLVAKLADTLARLPKT